MNKKNLEDLYELSPMQQGILFHALYDSGLGVYCEQFSCTLEGELNVSAFKHVWQRVLNLYPVLRTFFIWQRYDKPLQAVLQQVKLPWEQHDWRGLSPTEQEGQLEAFLQADRVRGFDLSRAPLMRLTLIRTSDHVYRFLWSFHQLLLDGWSTALVLKEVFALYEALEQGQDVSPRQSRPYRDYIAWLQQQDLAKAEKFWRQALEGFTAPTSLAVDRLSKRGWGLEENSSEQQIRLSMETTAALQSLARRYRLTLNTLVQGAWALLLSRYSGEEDVTFGVVVSGRPTALEGVESMVGLFINTLPLRVPVPPNAVLLPWLRALQAQQVEGRQYEYSPLVQIHEWSEVPRGQPLFQSILVFENYPMDTALQERCGKVEIRHIRSAGKTHYPLTLVAEPGTELALLINYDSPRFDASTISRMLEHLRTLLEGMVANPQQRLIDIPLLTAVERHQLLVAWNDTRADFPSGMCVHQLFEAQVARKPTAVAAVYGSEQLTYSELNQQANQLAHHLQALGVGPEVRVGICVEHSLEMVVGLLGIFKAGGAYVALDPTYPKERLAFMLEDTQVPVILTQQRLLATLPKHGGQVVCLDADWASIAQKSEDSPASEVRANNLAYVLYTSGSTGKPKGVMIDHRSLVNYVCWFNRSLGDTVQSLPMISRLTFDASLKQIFARLARGEEVWILPSDLMAQPLRLLQVLNTRTKVGFNCVPSLWTAMLDTMQPGRAAETEHLTCLFISGEHLTKELVNRSFVAFPHLQIWNLYGPTETTANASCARIVSENNVTIGHPIANTQIYLLDTHLHLVPIGVPGELYIGGVGVGRGYLHQPELTAERFVPHPFSDEPGARLYRTGDLARYLPDGTIELQGRLDHQVKIRGYRVELGEIEAVLSGHPAVRESAVTVREDTPGEKCLVAYITLRQNQAPTVDNLRAFLKEQLPDYMVPSDFVVMDAFPRTPSSGKVDRHALPAPAQIRAGTQEVLVMPRDTLELQLIQIWEDILGIRPLGVTDDFFELGGHSLLAVRMLVRIQKQFGWNLPLAVLFQRATVEHLACTIRQRTASTSQSPLVGIQPTGSRRPLFFVHPIGGTVLCYIELARSLGSDQPFYGLQAVGIDNEWEQYTQLEDLATHYIEAVRLVQPQEPYLLGGWSMGGVVAFEMAQQLQRQGQEVLLLALLDSRVPTFASDLADYDDTALLAEFARDLGELFAKDLPVLCNKLRQFSHEEQLRYVLEQMRMANLAPPDTGLVQIRRLFHVFKTNVLALRGYVPQPYPNKVVLFQSSEQSEEDRRNSTMNWIKLAAGGVEIHVIPGNHYTIVRRPHVQILAQRLKIHLDEAQGA